VNVTNGNILAHVANQGERPEVAWSEVEKSSPRLLVATGTKLNAFRILAKK
jgi:hypothetical protein